MEELNDELKQAYKKLKSYLYADKSLLEEKILISIFEENLEENLNNLEQNMKSCISCYLEQISYTLVPKKMEKIEKLSDNIYSNKTKSETYIVESKNIFIKAPIEIHLIATLWIMKVGEKLDKTLEKNVKGNRLFRDKNGLFKNNSYKLFHPYFEGYQAFRDEAIDMATHLHHKKLDVTLLNLDIQEFYYNIDFKFSDISGDTLLNNFMQQIHDKFYDVIKDLKPRKEKKGEISFNQKKFLPIGLVSSSLIANYVLSDFDKDIVENLKPEYYSRYVDDMLFVFSNARISLESKTIVSDLLKCKLRNTKIRNGKKNIQIKTANRKFKLQNNKVKIFQFDKNNSISLLDKFKEKIEENSSFFNFMPDDKKLFKTLESSSYNMFYDNSENKLSSIIGTAKDTLNISRNLSGVLATVSNANFDKEHLNIYNSQLKNVFSGKNIFELRLHWEKVFTYLYIIKNYELFVEFYKEFDRSIKKLSCKDLAQNVLKYLNNCVLFSIVANPIDFKNIIMDKIILNDIPAKQLINTIHIDSIRNANMFSSHLITYPLLNYLNYSDNGSWALNEDFNLLTTKIGLGNLEFEINKQKINNSPRFIHYHEIILYNFFKQLNENNIYKTEIQTILNDYINFNGFSESCLNTFPEGNKNKLIIPTDESKDKLKLGIVSLKVDIKNIEASYMSSPNLDYGRLQEFFDILNNSISKQNKIDLLIFPEVSIPYAWIHLFAKFAKKNSIGIIFGVEHIKIDNSIYNYTCVMLPFTQEKHTSLFINFEAKKHFAPIEKIAIESRGFIAKEDKNKEPIFYKYKGAVFSTINCYELSDIGYRSKFIGEVDFLTIIEYNHDTNYFSNIIDSASRDLHCYIAQVNSSDFGDSRIVQPTKSESKDILKLKGGENIYLVINSVDIKKLREFQKDGHYLQIAKKDFKLTPPDYKISKLRDEEEL